MTDYLGVLNIAWHNISVTNCTRQLRRMIYAMIYSAAAADYNFDVLEQRMFAMSAWGKERGKTDERCTLQNYWMVKKILYLCTI